MPVSGRAANAGIDKTVLVWARVRREMARLPAFIGCVLMGAFVVARGADQAPFSLAALGDCEKITKDGPVPPSPHFWDAQSKRLTLHGGRNEMLGAQLMLRATAGDVKDVNVEIDDLKGPSIIPAANIQLSLELYQFVVDGSWSWGPASQMLPSKKWYPEVLAPFLDPYDSAHKPVGAPFVIKTDNGPNQGVWIDVYVPKDAAPGKYQAPIRISQGGAVKLTATLELTVHNFTLPDQTHVDGYGEIYGRAYGFHGVSCNQDSNKWWQVARRYHQMAHQHRFVISERNGAGPSPENWNVYDKTYGSVLDGTCFTPEQGYTGPGQGTGVAFWRTPFAQSYDSKVPDFDDAKLKDYTDRAREFWEHCRKNKWENRRFFAYIIDEAGSDARSKNSNKKLQEALDQGAGANHINLMWTSHTDPATFANDPARDLRGVIRWWSPNGGACDPGFLQPRVAAGETAWFYHDGHPSVGVHGVNATGVELRTWGTICWRYKLSGSYWWAMDLGDADHPLQRPCYKNGETRWGNGVLFYPGARLMDVGLPNIDGPLSCLRMKAYRRGLQDYEYGWLLQQAGRQKVADDAIKHVIPLALTEALPKNIKPGAGGDSQKTEQAGRPYDRGGGSDGAPPWSTDVNDWYQMREGLAAALEAAR